MPLFHLVILALVQGLTEFLPVSSSGHLVFAHAALGNGHGEENLVLDIAVHVGTLLAVLFYFRRDIFKMAHGLLTYKERSQKDRDGAKLALYVVVGSFPVIIAGFVMHLLQPDWMRSLHVTAFCTIFFGVVLWLSDRRPVTKTLEKMNYKSALFIGFAQILALIPGTSRSGITMTAARFLGYNRPDAARFSLLLAVIAISGAGALTGFALLEEKSATLTISALYAAGLAALSGYVAIALLMRWLEKASFTAFAVYRLLVGAALYYMLYAGMIG